MRSVNLAGTALLAIAVAMQVSRAQGISLTVADAEGEGLGFPHAAQPAVMPSMFYLPFAGTDRRVCTRSLPDDSIPDGSLRSGEFLLRGRFTGPWGLHADKGAKMLWMPLHGPVSASAALSGREWRKEAMKAAPLLLRAVRVGYPADSLRQTVTGLAGGPEQFGFPSDLRFPTSGEWLVVATAGDDWGCFLLTVAP